MSEDPTARPVRPRVVIADAYPPVVRELQALLEPEFDVVGKVGDGRALVAMVESRGWRRAGTGGPRSDGTTTTLRCERIRG